MIKIAIYRCKDKNERKKLRKAAEFFIQNLMPLKKRLNVKIIIDQNLLKEEKISGSCEPQDFAVNHIHYDFNIHIDATMNFADKLSILAHELTHVKQYTTGQLYSKSKDPDVSIWEGKEYNDKLIDYGNRPWEIDAQFYEEKLLDEILKTDIWK